MKSKQKNRDFEIEREREQQDHARSQYSLKLAHYQPTNEVSKRCNVCDSGQIVLGTGIRLCKQHTAFVTCGATCDLQILATKYKMLEKGQS